MPSKFNKFKPPGHEGAVAQRNKKARRREAALPGDVAPQPAAAAAPHVVNSEDGVARAAAEATSRDGCPPPPKKQRRQPHVLPAPPPTVVLPAPKAGPVPPSAASSNWSALKAAMQQQAPKQHRANTAQRQGGHAAAQRGTTQHDARANQPHSIGGATAATKVVAIDCEMVGVGPGGQRSALARVCIVNASGNVLLDRWVRPTEKVTDFRTRVSGVRACNLRSAAPFAEVQRQVADLLQGRIIVGHAIENDLEVLQLSHGRLAVRDTAKYAPLMKAQARTGKLKPRALRHLAAEHLGLTIQEGEHCPVADARAALYLYLKHRREWERWLAAGGQHARGGGNPRPLLSLEELARRDAMADL